MTMFGAIFIGMRTRNIIGGVLWQRWRDIPNYEGMYKVSSLGKVKSFKYKEKLLKLIPCGLGYLKVNLYNNGAKRFEIHKLVAMSFLNYIPIGITLVVNHINGDKENNCVSNIEVVTHRENLSVCFRKDRENVSSKYPGVSKSKKSKKWQASIRVNRILKYLGRFDTELSAYNAYLSALSKIIRRQ